jgi:autotransporter-associated beta strand protein
MGHDQSGGNLTIDIGDAAIILTGDTNISGAVTINSGALEGNISPFTLLVLDPNTAYVLHADKIIKSLSGTANSVVDLGTNNLTIGKQGTSVNPETYSGNITGTGGVIIDGDIQLALNGENTYTGDTTINSGTLTTTASSLVGNITNNSNLIFNQSTNGTYAGNISGSGPVTIEGGGSVTLTGTNNNTGKVTINNDGSSLIGSTSNIPRNILNNSTNGLVFNQSTDGTYGGDISGSGKVTIEGGGVVTLTGTNSYTGITSINGESGVMGTASMFLGGVENNGAQGLIFSQSTDTPQTYAGDISGSGKVTIQSDEIINMTFTGNNSYTGGTVIDGNNSTLTVTTSNILGRVLLANNGTFIFNQSTNGTYAGDITGAGGGVHIWRRNDYLDRD